MNKLLIIAAALPLLSIGGGYGIGMALSGAPSTKIEVGKSEAEPQKAPYKSVIANAASSAEKAPAPAMQQGTAKPPAKSHYAKPEAHGGKVETAASGTGHKLAATQEMVETQPAPDPAHAAEVKSSKEVVKLGQITVPVYRPKSVTYIVADLGVAMPDAQTAAHYRVAENAVFLRDAIVASFRRAAENPKMKRAKLDSDWLSKTLTKDLRSEVEVAQEVLFLTLFKKDVPRS